MKTKKRKRMLQLKDRNILQNLNKIKKNKYFKHMSANFNYYT